MELGAARLGSRGGMMRGDSSPHLRSGYNR
jgi:hypothetical protein